MHHLDNWLWVLLILGGLFVVFYVVVFYLYAPVAVKRTLSRKVQCGYAPIDLAALPPEVSGAFHAGSRALAGCGFRSTGSLWQPANKAGVVTYVSIWANLSTLDSAQIIGSSVHSPIPLVDTLVTFSTHFRDGSSIVTSNWRSAGVFPRRREASVVVCPGIHDLALLYRFHCSRVGRDQGERIKTLERVEDALAGARREHEEEYARLIDAGYYTLDAEQQVYRGTWKGAFLMCYKVLPPLKQIRKACQRHRADRVLRELGFGGLGAFRRAQRIEATTA